MISSDSGPAFRILPLGDSITKGSPEKPGGYRGFLEQSLRAADISFEFVGTQELNSSGMRYPRHEGHSGARIDELRLGRVSELSNCVPIGQTIRELQPDCVLLLAGTNDLYFACPEKSANEISLLMNEIFQAAPAISIILGTLLPILPGPKPWGSVVPADVTERVSAFNSNLANLVQNLTIRRQSILLADLSGCVESKNDLQADGVHPTGHVMERMAKVWHASVLQLLKSRTRPARPN